MRSCYIEKSYLLANYTYDNSGCRFNEPNRSKILVMKFKVSFSI